VIVARQERTSGQVARGFEHPLRTPTMFAETGFNPAMRIP
jgi:hypothetical protein